MKTMYALLLFSVVTAANAAQSISTTMSEVTQQLKTGCEKELASYCKNVSPGEGRVFACLYSYSNQISLKCEHAMYDVASELEFVISKIGYVADSCASDITQYCATAQAGDGRIASCLKRNRDKLTATCRRAIVDTGMAAN